MVAPIGRISAGSRSARADASATRPVGDDDFALLAELMVAAYAGTVDDEGGGVPEALDELRMTAAGDYGDPLRDAWLLTSVGAETETATETETNTETAAGDASRIASAVLCTRWRGRPFVAFVMTRPEFAGQGHASHLLAQAAAVIERAGDSELTLVVTRSSPAMGLYLHLGFTEASVPPA